MLLNGTCKCFSILIFVILPWLLESLIAGLCYCRPLLLQVFVIAGLCYCRSLLLQVFVMAGLCYCNFPEREFFISWWEFEEE